MFFRTRKEYQLRIDNPCEQNWNEMEPAEKGKFCLHCSKKVIDFTNLNDQEILPIIKQASGKLCGRLTQQQLDRLVTQEKTSTCFPLISKIAASILILAVNTEVVSAQQKSSTNVIAPVKSSKKKLSAKPIQKIIRGCVLNAETRDPLAGVTVSIKSAANNVCANKSYTNEYGDFEIEISNSLLSQPIILTFQFNDFEYKEFYISERNLSLVQEFLLIRPLVVKPPSVDIPLIKKGGLAVVEIKKKKWWQFWKISV